MYVPTGSPYGRVFTVYCQTCWWDDKLWSPLDFGIEVDLTKPFFEQFKQLQQQVPRVAITNTNSENSAYTNYTANNKNCYMVFSNSYGHNEDCYYGTMLAKNRNCIDAIQIEDCELCYDCVDCKQSYRLVKCSMCDNCQESFWLEDCRGCSNCFMGKGLRNKQYYILNQSYTKAAYFKKLAEYKLNTQTGFTRAQTEFADFALTLPAVYSYQLNTEHCSGDYIANSVNCRQCFDTADSEQCSYLQYSVNQNKEVYDCSYSGGCELGIENLSYVGGYNCLGCHIVWWNVANLAYCELCFNNTSDCFGCIGLRGKKYCIFNKQYTKIEYERLVKQLKASMTQEQTWSQFFPANLSPFGYNETVAQEYFPLTKVQAQKAGYLWKDESAADLSNTAGFNQCQQCCKNFKLIKQEINFYKQLNLPVPALCFNCRHKARLFRRRPRQLWPRQCAKCHESIQTTFTPTRPELVYCAECYCKILR